MTQHSCSCPTPCCVFRCLRCTNTRMLYPNGNAFSPIPDGHAKCIACAVPTLMEWVNYEKWRATHDTWSTPRHPYRHAPTGGAPDNG